MSMLRRFGFMIGLNVAIVVTISIITSVLGVGNYMSAQGLNYGSLIVFCLIWGMGGAFISLLLSKVMAKWMMGVRIIDSTVADPKLRELVGTVHQLARAAGLRKMPEVGVYDSPEVNAFATGPTKNNSLVAVSTGLLYNMDKQSIDGVLGHEVAHIANGDMVTMTLIQGVVNAFVMALARVIAFAIDNVLRKDDDGGGLGQFGYMIAVIVLEMLFLPIGMILVAWFSRQREFRADAGGARLAGRENMVQALRSLQRVSQINNGPEAQNAPAYASMKISSTRKSRFAALFSTHPALEARIEALQRGTR